MKTLTSWLWVNKPSASILGSREKHVNLGDSVTMSCELRDTVVAPQYVFWYHNNNMINFQPGVSVVTLVLGQDTDSLWVAPPNTTVARLTISQTRLEDAGNYTCAPENMVQDTVRLSISKGKHWDWAYFADITDQTTNFHLPQAKGQSQLWWQSRGIKG